MCYLGQTGTMFPGHGHSYSIQNKPLLLSSSIELCFASQTTLATFNLTCTRKKLPNLLWSWEKYTQEIPDITDSTELPPSTTAVMAQACNPSPQRQEDQEVKHISHYQ